MEHFTLGGETIRTWMTSAIGTRRHFFAAVKLVCFWGGADISLVSWIGASVVNDPSATFAH
jgi:hypothetical protein